MGRGGNCTTHGRGAKLVWEPTVKREVGPGGKVVVTKGRKYSYVCDVGRGGGRLRQARLNFSRMTPNNTIEEGGEEAGEEQGDVRKNTSEGQ